MCSQSLVNRSYTCKGSEVSYLLNCQKSEKLDNTKCWHRYEPTSVAAENVHYNIHSKEILSFPIKIKLCMPYGPGILFHGV